MRKIIGIVIASLVFCSVGYAGIQMYEGNKFWIAGHMETVVATVCVDGYKFVHSRGIRAVSIVQFYEEAGRPARC